jgi:hypothetical protein
MTHFDDASAILYLKAIVQTHFEGNEIDTRNSPELQTALAAAFGDPHLPATSEGDLARAALDLLAEDPAFAGAIEVAALEPAIDLRTSSQHYLDGSAIALTSAALVVLSTRVKFKVDSSNKWSFELDKKAIGDSVLKLFVERLLAVLRK